MVQIVPTILVRTKQEFQERLARLAEVFERIQIDIIDGKFTPDKTADITKIDLVNFTGKVDVHLMVEEPIFWVEKCRKIGASLAVGHIEKMGNQQKFIEAAKMGGMKAGLALDFKTPLELLEKKALNQIDHILLMARPAGFTPHQFDEKVLEKIKKVKVLIDPQVEIGVDGGIREDDIRQVVQAGAGIVYVGKAIWELKNMRY